MYPAINGDSCASAIEFISAVDSVSVLCLLALLLYMTLSGKLCTVWSFSSPVCPTLYFTPQPQQIMVTSLKFFLTGDEGQQSDEDSSSDSEVII